MKFCLLLTLSLYTHKRDGSGEILKECYTEFLTIIKNVAFVGVERSLLSLKDFDFAPSIALTHAQLFSHLVTESVLMAFSGDKPLLDPDFDWIIDSGCTTHMCRNSKLLKDIHTIQSKITIAGPDTAVTKIGTACFRAELKDKVTIFTLHNTLLVPFLFINLISQSKLEGKFYINTKQGYQVRSRETDEVYMEARIVDGLYVINQERPPIAMVANPTLATWHERLGHINVQRLKTMRDEGIPGIMFSDNELGSFKCESCILGKAHRAAIHNTPVPKSTIPGQVTHWDTCGPIAPSISGSTYMVVGVDEATRWVFVGFHKSKDTVNSTIREVVTKVDTQRGPATVKRVHSDNEGEFCSKDFDQWVETKGILHTTSAPHTPEHNGLAEWPSRPWLAPLAACSSAVGSPSSSGLRLSA